jgi:hypothetical protein
MFSSNTYKFKNILVINLEHSGDRLISKTGGKLRRIAKQIESYKVTYETYYFFVAPDFFGTRSINVLITVQ